MSSKLVAETIWQVSLYARECFSHLGPLLPKLAGSLHLELVVEGDNNQLPCVITT
jgi:hypothetical protein